MIHSRRGRAGFAQAACRGSLSRHQRVHRTFEQGAAVGAAVVRFDRAFEPDAAHRGYYDDRFGHYCALYDALTPFNARFGR